MAAISNVGTGSEGLGLGDGDENNNKGNGLLAGSFLLNRRDFNNATPFEQDKIKEVIALLSGMKIHQSKTVLRIASNYYYQLADKKLVELG